MIVELRISGRTSYINVPNNIISNANNLRDDFLEWMSEQPECIYEHQHGKRRVSGYSFNEDVFLKYLNDVVLNDFNERAYFIPDVASKRINKTTVIWL